MLGTSKESAQCSRYQPGFAKAKEEHAAVPEIGEDESPNRSLV